MNLDIYLAGRHVARTAPRSRGTKFAIEYTDEVRDSTAPESILLSCSLPTPGPSGPSVARAFLEGLLPEGHALEVMAARVRGVQLDSGDGSPATPEDGLNLLAAYGRECAGAVALVLEGEGAPGPGHYIELTHSEVSARLADLPNRPLGSDPGAGIRLSLAGNQPKLLLARLGATWYEPVDGAAATHIIKPTGAWPWSADNEAIVLQIARSLGLTPSVTWVEDFDGSRALVTERFDRTIDQGTLAVKRRHQEDMCQALGLRPRDKYAIGRPSQRMATLLRRVPAAPGTDAQKLFEQIVFRAIVGDEDGHGKNYGLMIEDGEVALSPLYDSLVTMVYPELSGQMGTPIGRQAHLARLDLDALVEEGRACGLPERTAISLASDLADRINGAVGALSDDGLDDRAFTVVTRTIATRATRLLDGDIMGSPPRGCTLGARRRGVVGTFDAASRRAMAAAYRRGTVRQAVPSGDEFPERQGSGSDIRRRSR